MDVNCAVHVLQNSSTQKWKNRHLKQCVMHTAELFKIRISRRNQNRIRKYFSLFIRGLDRFNHEKNGGRKYRDTLPLMQDLIRNRLLFVQRSDQKRTRARFAILKMLETFMDKILLSRGAWLV